ncbi:hypothetical protein HCU64_06710 [Methylobacterium sp. C25]|uniref:LexA family protein n=1 Tax=Methylobacterium sp. C25 TaxID=2721622 RepID=UPI001F34B4F9|nr:S24 family peptidase [Methylobacterium sp. C25]MCE4223437.1 hypothetical protein [Methylobacterium sp. C25]
MANLLKERVLARLAALELGPVEAATKGGLERTFIRDITHKDKQTVTVRMMPRLAAALATTSAYLSGEIDDPAIPSEAALEARPSHGEMITVPKVGRVEAGEFREVLEFDDSEREFLLEHVDEEFPRARMVAFEVVGDSMNRAEPAIAPGSVVICVDFDDTGLPLMDGMIVVLERTRNGGLTREWSVKEVVTFNDRNEFQPRSSSAKHETIVVRDKPDADNGVEVKVLGLVRRISTPVPRFKQLKR